MKKPGIRIPLEGVLHFAKTQKKLYGKEFTEKHKKMLTTNYNKNYQNGKVVAEGDYGEWVDGIVGGKFRDWSLEEMKQLLDEANIKYEDVITERIDVHI